MTPMGRIGQELAAGTHVFSTLFSFDGANGRNPYGGVIEDANGNLFGTTAGGGCVTALRSIAVRAIVLGCWSE